VVERSFLYISNYRRLNTILEGTKEHLVVFVEIVFVSILSRRMKRLLSEEACAWFLQTASKLWSVEDKDPLADFSLLEQGVSLYSLFEFEFMGE